MGTLRKTGAVVRVLGIASLGWAAHAQEMGLAERVRAILNNNCFSCHGQNHTAAKGILILDHRRLLSAKIIVPGDADSILIRQIETKRMPPGPAKLPAASIALIKEWVRQGAPTWGEGDDSGTPAAAGSSQPGISAVFQPDTCRLVLTVLDQKISVPAESHGLEPANRTTVTIPINMVEAKVARCCEGAALSSPETYLLLKIMAKQRDGSIESKVSAANSPGENRTAMRSEYSIPFPSEQMALDALESITTAAAKCASSR